MADERVLRDAKLAGAASGPGWPWRLLDMWIEDSAKRVTRYVPTSERRSENPALASEYRQACDRYAEVMRATAAFLRSHKGWRPAGHETSGGSTGVREVAPGELSATTPARVPEEAGTSSVSWRHEATCPIWKGAPCACEERPDG